MKDMIDNRKVGDRKGGIAAKIQREKPAKTWQNGDMSGGMHKGDMSHWKRGSGGSLTPRKA